MFAKIIAIATFATLAAAQITNSCNTAQQYCCNSVQNAQSAEASKLLGLLNVDVNAITAQVGLNCTPLSVIGIGGNSCKTQSVCCTGNNYNGLAVIGCSPISAL